MSSTTLTLILFAIDALYAIGVWAITMMPTAILFSIGITAHDIIGRDGSFWITSLPYMIMWMGAEWYRWSTNKYRRR